MVDIILSQFHFYWTENSCVSVITYRSVSMNVMTQFPCLDATNYRSKFLSLLPSCKAKYK